MKSMGYALVAVLGLMAMAVGARDASEIKHGSVDSLQLDKGLITIDRKRYHIDNEAIYHVAPVSTATGGLQLVAPRQALESLKKGRSVRYRLDGRQSSPPRIGEIWINP